MVYHTSGGGSDLGEGDKGSLSSGIESCTRAVPFVVLDSSVSIGDSNMVPLGASELGNRECVGDSCRSADRGACDDRLRGEFGRRSCSEETPKASRSFDLPLPKPLKVEPRLEDDFRSGDDARP